MRVDGVAAAAEGARRLVSTPSCRTRLALDIVRSQLLEVTSGHKFCQFAARVWRAHRVWRSASGQEEGNLELRRHFTQQPRLCLSLGAHTAQIPGDAVPLLHPPPHPRNRASLAARAHFRGK